ncbi:MAG: hypothetical protein U9Q99_02880 [Nanoarchaeota archaeon]|nr:hypothetical protein [Nanoarchaeota archaeon]
MQNSEIYDFDIYDLAFLIKEDFPKISNEKALSFALFNIFIENGAKQIIDFLGQDVYLDFKSLDKKFHEKKFDYFLKEADLIDIQNSNLTNLSSLDKLKIVWKCVYSNSIETLSYPLFAEKIRKKHFPSSGLESVIIANGTEYYFKGFDF